MKLRRKELGSFGLCLPIQLGAVSERLIELLAELGGFGVRERVHSGAIFDDRSSTLAGSKSFLRVSYCSHFEGVVRAVQKEDFCLTVSGAGAGR